MNSISADHPDHEEAANDVPLSSSVGASRREQDPKSEREKQADTQGLMSAHQDQPLGPTPGTIHEFTPMTVDEVGLYEVEQLDDNSDTPRLSWGSTPQNTPNEYSETPSLTEGPPLLTVVTVGVDEDSETPSLTEGSALSTSGSTEEVREAAEAIAGLLMADDVLGPLYKKALAVLKIDDLDKRFRKLLKACATELRTEASNTTQQSASQFLRRRVRYVVSHMGTCLDPQRNEKAQRLQELASEEPNKRAQIHAYLNDGAVGPDVQEPDAVSNSGSSEQDAPENPYSLSREQVKSFILNSVALVNLRNKFSQFVLQRQSQGGDFIGTLPDSPSAARVTQGEPVPLEPNLAADGITDGSDVSPGSLNVAGREHPYAEDETRPREHFLWDILQRHAYLGRCIQIVLQVAEFLELRERMLEPGLKRVRWTCVSASQRLFAH